MKLAKKKYCTACMACIDCCTHDALSFRINEEGYFEIVQYRDKCVDCQLCTKVCPILSPLHTNGMDNSRPYAAWNTNPIQRKQSASGGIFAAIATAVLNGGGIVYGSSIQGFDVKHIRIDDINELHKLQGSKYQHSEMIGIYRQVRRDLLGGRCVLFSGLGCQVDALLKFLGKMNIEKLFTIDTICGGISSMLPMLNLKMTRKYAGIKSFRDKINGWKSKGFNYSLKMILNDKNIDDLGCDNMILESFSSKILKRSSCLSCHYTGFHRNSDITIGDFWGDIRFSSQHQLGLSSIAIHNNRIKFLLGESKIEMADISWGEFIAHNPNYYWTNFPHIRYFPSRKLALNALKKEDYVTAKKYLQYNSLWGYMLRIYLRLNDVERTLYLKEQTKQYIL